MFGLRYFSVFCLSVSLALAAPPPTVAQSDVLNTLLGIGTAIVINETQRQQQQQQQSVQPRQSQPQPQRGPAQPRVQPDPQLQLAQQRLTALGYDPGPADGLMGNRTRNAIVQFQSSIGSPATGVLSASDTAALLAPPATPSASITPQLSTPATDTGFTMLQGMDLPFNDFRSGMTEAALKDIPLSSCQAACQADPACRAFTYNSRASVCFLKSAAGTPTPFDGAVSGVRSGASPFPLVAAQTERALDRNEVAQLQAGLNTLGYDAGTPDGLLGSRTRNAIAQFITDRPGQVGNAVTTSLLAAVTGSTQSAAPSPDPVSSDQYVTFEEVARDLDLIAFALRPDLLTDDAVVKRAFERDNGSVYSRTMTPLGETFAAANAVDQQVMLAEYRTQLAAEAAETLARLNTEGLRIKVIMRTPLGGFVPGRGIEMSPPVNQPLIQEKRLVHTAYSFTGSRFEGVSFEMPELRWLPMGSEAEASAFLEDVRARSWNGMTDLVAYLTITEFGVDSSLSGATVQGDNRIPMTVRLDAIQLETVARTGSDSIEGGIVLASLYTPGANSQPTAPASDITALAQHLGLPHLNGHLLFPSDPNSSSELLAGESGVAYSRMLNLLLIAKDPELGVENLVAGRLSGILDQSQHLRVFGRPSFSGFANEFERQRAIQVFRDEVMPQLLAQTPELPMPVALIRKAPLGEYDFINQSFPIQYYSSATESIYWLHQTLIELRSPEHYQNMPETLPMDMASAERLITASGNSRPALYVATFGTLDLRPVPEERRVELDFVAERAAVYTSADLAEQYMALDATQIVNDPRVAAATPEAPTPQLSGAEALIAQYPPTSELTLLGQAYKRLVGTGQEQALIESFREVREANEFEQQSSRENALQLLSGAEDAPVWLWGGINLGPYDIEAEGFSPTGIELAPPERDSGFSASMRFTLADTRLLERVSVPPDLARRVVETGNRVVPILAQVEIVGVSSEPSGSSANVAYSVALRDVIIIAYPDGDSAPPVLIARVEPGDAPAPAAPVTADAITTLTPDTLDYVRLKLAPDSITSNDWSIMMASRWVREQKNGFSGERFFPAGLDLTGPGIADRWLPDFQDWATARAEVIGDTLTIPFSGSRFGCIASIDGAVRSPVRDAAMDRAPELADIESIVGYREWLRVPHILEPVAFEISGDRNDSGGIVECAANLNPAVLASLELDNQNRASAVVIIDAIAMPGQNALPARENATEIDIAITGHALIARADLPPVLLLEADFVQARFSSGGSVITTSRADFDTIAAAMDVGPTPVPEGWDIVGLTPGMTLQEAEAAISEHMDVTAVLRPMPGMTNHPHFRNQRLFISSALNEAINLIYENTDEGEVVFGIVREVGQPSRTMPMATLVESLTAKFGPVPPPDLRGEHFALRWQSQTEHRSAGSQPVQCYSLETSAPNWELESGEIVMPADGTMPLLSIVNYVVLPTFREIDEQSLHAYALDCGMMASAQKNIVGNADRLTQSLFDPAGYLAAFESAQQSASNDGADTEEPEVSLGFSL